MRFTNSDKANGEMAARYLSKKAYDYYSGSDVTIYEKDGDLYLEIDTPEKMSLEQINSTLEYFADMPEC